LHLHPSWQQRIITDLRRTFPNVQFVCTTHSPQILSTVPPGCIRTVLESGRIAKPTCCQNDKTCGHRHDRHCVPDALNPYIAENLHEASNN
jgi:predicted ATP-binding protein involved in virulence